VKFISASGQLTYPEHDGFLDSFYCVNGEKYVMEKTDRRGMLLLVKGVIRISKAAPFL
jgi:hypothetical protein